MYLNVEAEVSGITRDSKTYVQSMHLKESVRVSTNGQYFRRQQNVGAVGTPHYSRKLELRYVVLK